MNKNNSKFTKLFEFLCDLVEWIDSHEYCESLWYREQTVEAVMMETGVRHGKQKDNWQYNRETRSIKPRIPDYVLHRHLAAARNAIESIETKNVLDFIYLAHKKFDHPSDPNKTIMLTDDQVAKGLRMSRMHLWRKRGEWYNEINSALLEKKIKIL